jgi:hypothetical protein
LTPKRAGKFPVCEAEFAKQVNQMRRLWLQPGLAQANSAHAFGRVTAISKMFRKSYQELKPQGGRLFDGLAIRIQSEEIINRAGGNRAS